MKRRKKTCFFTVLFLLALLAGCQNKGGARVVVDETGPVDEDTVIWMTDSPEFDAGFEEEFNRRLQELGCNSKVDFRGLPGEEYWHYAETGELPDYSNADIATLVGEYDFTSYYSDLAREGKICDLTAYLADGVGKELYDSMPEEIWQSMEVDGHIYGILNPNVRINRYLAVNQTDIKRYSLDIQEGLTMEDLIQMAYVVQSEEKGRGLLEAAYSQDYLPDTYLPANNYPKIAIYQQEGEWGADLLIDLEEYQEHLTTLNKLYQDGILVPVSETGSDILAWIEVESDEESALNRVKESLPGEWTVIECQGWSEPLQAGGWRTVLWEVSNKKEMARQILFLAYTDQELSEMLAYGTGFKEDSGRIKTDMDRSALYGNRFLIRPEVSDPENYREKLVDVFRDSEKKEWLGFWPDLREIQKEWRAVIEVQRAHEDFYRGLSEDMEAEEAVIREELKGAGIDIVLEELNRQVEEFQQKKQNK